MAAIKNEDDVPVVISGNKARSGVTGHHVRYVLAFGLAGGVIAFVVITLYFYYAKLTQAIYPTSARIDPVTLISYALPLALAAVATVLLLGLWNMIMPRGTPNVSQTLTRWRVVLQFIALCLVMAALYLTGK